MKYEVKSRSEVSDLLFFVRVGKKETRVDDIGPAMEVVIKKYGGGCQFYSCSKFCLQLSWFRMTTQLFQSFLASLWPARDANFEHSLSLVFKKAGIGSQFQTECEICLQKGWHWMTVLLFWLFLASICPLRDDRSLVFALSGIHLPAAR